MYFVVNPGTRGTSLLHTQQVAAQTSIKPVVILYGLTATKQVFFGSCVFIVILLL